VTKTVRGMATSDGDGVTLTRIIGTPRLRGVGPFLMLDEFRSDEPKDYLAGFPDHPHRGFETFTYMLAGKFRHRDNKGHEGVLGPGGGQWMTAGRGSIVRPRQLARTGSRSLVGLPREAREPSSVSGTTDRFGATPGLVAQALTRP
jgi:redox-sensitive bicupin YhaK (pirin superfamily)